MQPWARCPLFQSITSPSIMEGGIHSINICRHHALREVISHKMLIYHHQTLRKVICTQYLYHHHPFRGVVSQNSNIMSPGIKVGDTTRTHQSLGKVVLCAKRCKHQSLRKVLIILIIPSPYIKGGDALYNTPDSLLRYRLGGTLFALRGGELCALRCILHQVIN